MIEAPNTAKVANVADLLSRASSAWPDSVAVIHPKGALTFGELDRLVWALCSRLRRHGLEAGDVVGIHVVESISHLCWLLALGRGGMPSVAVPQSSSRAAGLALLRRTNARGVISDQAGDWEVPVGIFSANVVLEAGEADVGESHRQADPSEVFIYKTSSGTMGAPKIVASTHAGMLASIEREQIAIGYPRGERYLTPVEITHDGPRRRLLACLASGGTIVFPPERADVPALIQCIERFNVRHFSCVPVQGYLLAVAMEGRRPFSEMRCFRLSAGPSERELHGLLRQRVAKNVVVSYGCTELGPMTVASPELLARQPESVGVAMPGVEVEVVNSADRGEPGGESGLLRVRAIGMPTEYHDDPVATSKAFSSGWFYPGDFGRIDKDGHVFHLGRADDMMIFNGLNISPVDIERVILAHEAVADAIALPLKRPVVNDVPVCAVALRAGRSVSAGDLISWAQKSLGARAPKFVLVMEKIPRNEVGKPVRSRILEEVARRIEGMQASPESKP